MGRHEDVHPSLAGKTDSLFTWIVNGINAIISLLSLSVKAFTFPTMAFMRRVNVQSGESSSMCC